MTTPASEPVSPPHVSQGESRVTRGHAGLSHPLTGRRVPRHLKSETGPAPGSRPRRHLLRPDRIPGPLDGPHLLLSSACGRLRKDLWVLRVLPVPMSAVTV